jgi:large repetitive protein
MENEIFSKPFRWLRPLQLLIWIGFFGLSISEVGAQTVLIPRAGFPYCQPFMDTENSIKSRDPNLLPFTIAKGNTVLNYATGAVSPDRNLALTGNSLELTPDSPDERGYILIDLPFSSEYGIKASFEYFIFKDPSSGAGFLGDGFSFFLIDGTTTAATFQIGGVGGSLGYAPHGSNSSGQYSSGGVTGGYMGIGFDVLGNFGNFQEKRFGGFQDPNQFNFSTPNPDIRFYPDAISIRGPLQVGDIGRDNGSPATNSPPAPPYNSYQFKGGKIVYFDPGLLFTYPVSLHPRIALGSGELFVTNPSLFLGTSEQFKISTGLRPEEVNCETALPSGYRKVFIDLKPTGIPSKPYDITVEMLVGGNPTPIKILDNVRFEGAAPTSLKIGFAASTGGDYYANHHIRNLAVQVSSIEDAAKPIPPALFREVCVDEANTVDFPFCVELPSSANAFIQCIQLYSVDPGVGDNDFDNDIYECGISGFCATRCSDDSKKKLDAFDAFGNKVGEFIAQLSDEVEVGKFNQAQIRFVRTDLSFYGTVTVYYKIVDNFGLESDGTPITITINPIPEIVSPGTSLDPTCDGQNDGELNGVVIKNLVDSPDKYTIEFYDENNVPVIYNLISEVVGSDGYITATFNLSGLNPGKIFVRAINPSSESLGPVCDNNGNINADPCILEDELLYEFTQVRGTPVTFIDPIAEICENTPVTFTPFVSEIYSENVPAPPIYLWYTDENKVNKIDPNVNQLIVNGNIIQTGDININSQGELSFESLLQGQYEFFVEIDETNFPTSGNFCFNRGPMESVVLTVFPELQTTFTPTPDWCRASIGAILVTAQGGTGNKTFTLYSAGSLNPLRPPVVVNGTTHTFSDLLPGDYEVEVFTENPSCVKVSPPITIEGPTTLLALTPVSTENSYCSLANGSLKFNLSGGNLLTGSPAYTILIPENPTAPISSSGNIYTVTGLSAGTYTIEATDAKGCTASIPVTVIDDPLSEFGTTNDEICEDEVASVSPTVVNLSSSIPVYQWYYKDGAGTYIQITNGTNPSGVTFTIDGSNKLSVSDLAPQATPYTYYLTVTGTKVCDQGYIPAEILVSPKPVLSTPMVTQINCNGAGNGTIQAQLASGNLGDFEYSLIGNNGVNRPFTTNSGLFNLLPPGTYELLIKSAKGCEASMTNLIITEPSPLVLTPISVENSYCSLANGSLKFNLQGGTQFYTITIDGNPLTSPLINGTEYTLNNLAAGTYSIRVVDDKGCQTSISQVIAADPPSVFGTTNDEICEDEVASVSPTVLNLSSSVPVYKWYYKDAGGNFQPIPNGLNLSGVLFTIDGSNKLSVSNLAPQATPYTYYLTVTGTKVCDQGYIPSEILVNPVPKPTAPILNQVTCNGAANGSIQAQLTSGNLADFEYSLIGNNGVNRPFATNSGLFNLLPPGTYELFIKSAKGCEASIANLIITEPSPLEINQVSKTDPNCATNNGEIRFTVTGATPDGTGKYGIKVNGADINTFGSDLIQNGPADFTLSNLAPGTYLIDTEDTNGCQKTLTVTLLNTEVPVFDVQDVSVCEGTDVVLTPQVISNTIGAIPVYSWSFENPSNPGQYIQINNGDVVNGITYTLSNGILTIKGLKYSVVNYNYYLAITGTNVCPAAPIQAEVKVLKIPAAVFEPVPVTCFGDSNGEIKFISVDPAGPNTFTLVQTGATNATGNFGGLTAGIYTVKVQENGSPCFAEFDVEVTQPVQLAIQNLASVNPTCGDSNGSIKFEIVGGITNYVLVLNNKPISYFTNSLTAGVYEVKNLAPDTYSLGVTDANGCQLNLPDLFTLTNDAGFNVVLNPIQEEVCFGQDLVLTPVFTSAIPITPLLNWYKDAALTQPITSSPTPDSDGVTYQINPSNGVLTISDQKAGIYTYYLEISGSGICTLVESALANVLPELLANITVENITCFGDTDGTITIVPSGGNGNFETSLKGSAFTTNLIYSNLAPGSYKIDLRNDVGCVFTETVIVETPTAAISINSPTIERASCDLSNGSIKDLVISGGWGSYAVEWRKGSQTGPVIPGDLTQAINLAPDSYFLLVSDAEGCKQVFPFTIEESSDPVYAIVPPINSCAGSPVVIRPIHIAPDPSLPPASATEVRWYTGTGQTGLIQNGPDAANPAIQYTIDDTDWLNPELVITGLPAGTHDFYFYVVCTGQEIKIDITVYDSPSITLETEAIVCFGDTNGKVRVLSGGIPTYTYSVNGGSPTNQAAFEALSLAAGTYSLGIATPAGCAQNLNFTISGPSAPLASSPLTKVDPGCGAPNGKLNLTITGGWLPYTLDVIKDGVSQGLQTINQSNISLDGYRPGVYQIRISDNEGCLVITNTVTLVDGPTQILADSDEICVGSLASLMPELNPVATGASFQWFLDAAKTQPIVSNPSPAADGRIYQINSATGELTIGNLPASATEYNYFVTASGSGVCPGFMGNGKVKVYSNPTVTATVVNEVCFGTGGSITVNSSGGSGSYAYSLNGGAFGSTNVFQVATGIYNVQVSTPEGCLVSVANIQVVGPGEALTTSNLLKDDPSCGLDNGEVRFTISGGYAPYSITYTKNGSNAGSTSLATAGEVRISNLGIGVYEFKVLDAQGCSIAVPNTLTLTEVATILTANDDEICIGEVAQSTPSVPQNIPNPQFIWSFDSQGSSLISNGIVNGVTYGINASGVLTVAGLSPRSTPYIYYVNATGVGICGLEYKPVSIKVNGLPVLRVSNPSVVCDPNGKVDLTDYIEGFNPSVYDYSVLSPSGNSMLLNEFNNVGISGDYRVSSSFKGASCFNQSQRIRVLIAETELIANFQYEADLGGGLLLPNAEIQIQEDVNFQDLSQGNVLIWDWNFGDGNSSSVQNPVHQYQEKGTYVVKLTTIDSIGCISSYEVIVEVLDDYVVMIPNAFTPTGAKNLTFRPYYRGIASMEFYIFNTWGELIYEAKSMEDQGWDGMLNGKNVPNGNYVYKGRFVSRSGEVITKSGVFVLIR